jgi:hypothetical protein
VSEPEDPSPATPTDDAPRTALPSVGARVLAFGAILLAGAAGGFIGYAFIDLQYPDGGSPVPAGLGGLLGAVLAAGGTAVVAVLTLRAMGEWHTIQAKGGPAPTSDRRGRRGPPAAPGPPPRVR